MSSTLAPSHPRSLVSAARRPLDLDKHVRHRSTSPDRYDAYAPRNHSPDYSSTEPKRSRCPSQDPVAPHSRSKYPDHYLVAEGGRSRHADPYPEHLLPPRGKHGDRYPEYEPTETGRSRGQDLERVVRRKERPARPPPPVERDKAWDRDGDRDRHRERDRARDLEWDRRMAKDQRRDEDRRRARAAARDRERSRDRVQSWDRLRERDMHRQRDTDRQRARTRSRDRGLDEERWHRSTASPQASWEEEEGGEDAAERERRARGRNRVYSGPEEVFEELRSDEGRGYTREVWDTRQCPGRNRSHTHPSEETGTILSSTPGSQRVFLFFLCGVLGAAFASLWFFFRCGIFRWWVDH